MFKDLFSDQHFLSSIAQKRLLATIVAVGTVFLVIAGQILGSIIVIITMLFAGLDEQGIKDAVSDNITIKFLSIAIVQISTIGLLYLLHKYLRKPFLKSISLGKKIKKEFLGYSLISYVLYFATFVTIALIVRIVLPVIDVEQMQQIGFDSPTGPDLIFVYLSLVLLPAFAEEVVFRGFLFQRLNKLISLRSAAIITSLIFGALHLEFIGDGPLNLIAALDTFVLSIFLIGLLVQTKSLWPSIILHMIKNSIAFVGLFILS